jgi:hypothetical protein
MFACHDHLQSTGEQTVAKTRNPKKKVVQVRVTPAEKLRIERVSSAENRTVSNWIYGVIMREMAAREESMQLKVAEPKHP